MSDLEQYRQEIDELDEQLVRLFLRRMEVTGKVGEYKLAHGMQVLDRERERRVLAKRASLAVDIRAGGGRKGAIPDHHGHQPPPAAGADRPQRHWHGPKDQCGAHRHAGQREVLRGGGPGGAAGDAPGGDGRHGGGKDGALHPGHFCPGRGGRLPPGGDRRRPPAAAMEGTVISTGGGIILRPENMEILSATGTVYFLDRDPRDIANTELDGRPCSAGGGTGYSCCMISASTCTANMPGTPSPAPRWMRRWTPSWPWCGGARTCADPRRSAAVSRRPGEGRETGVGK